MNFRAPNYFPDDSQQSYQGLLNALRGVTQDREDRRRFDIQEQRQRASEDFMRRQSAVAEARVAESDRRQKIKERLELSDRNKKSAGEISDLIRSGRPQEAAARARAGSYVDPESGEERSIQVDPGGESYDPGFDNVRLPEPMQPQGPPPNQLGSLLSGKLRAPLIGQDAPPEQPPPAGPTEPPPVGEENGAPVAGPPRRGLSALGMGQPPAIPTDQGKLTRRNPAMIMPGGERQEFDPRESERFQAEQAQQHKAKLMEIASDPAMPPDVRQAAALRAGLSGAQASGAEGAQIMGAAAQASGQRFKAGENEKYQMTAAQKHEIGMRPRAAGAGSEKAQVDLLGKKLTNETRYDSITAKVLSNYGFREGQTQRVKLSDLADQIAGASDSAALAGIARGSFVKLAQGGTGVISDNDMRVFWDRIGGLGIRSQELLHQALDGKLGPEKRDSVLGAIKAMEAKAVANKGSMEAALKARFATVPGGDEKLGGYLNTYFPERQAKPAAGAGAAPAMPPEGSVKQTSDGATFKVVGGRWRRQ